MRSFQVPHGHTGHFTYRLEITLPDGVLAARPEALPGWNITVTERAVAPYESHGRTVATGPHTIVYEAETADAALHHDHLMAVKVSMKFGCAFADPATALRWNLVDAYTLWFPTVQRVAAVEGGTLKPANAMALRWTLAPAGPDAMAPMGHGGAHVAPYIALEQWPKCRETLPGGDGRAGMNWLGAIVEQPDAAALTAAHVRQHVLDIVNEEALTIREAADGKFTTLSSAIDERGANLDDFGAELAAVRQRLAAVQAQADQDRRDRRAFEAVAVASLALNLTAVATALAYALALRARRPARFSGGCGTLGGGEGEKLTEMAEMAAGAV